MSLEDQIAALRAENEKLKEQLNRCFRGQVVQVRNELILELLERRTKELLAMPKSELRKYLNDKIRN